MEAPVLLITFNRPDTTRKVFEQIKKAKIKKLYVFNDAPRKGNGNDINARKEINNILRDVTWDCELLIFFSEKNLGCGPGPATAISWAFENEDRLIILEDDCVPAQSFFPYCNKLLEKYKNDARVWTISGNNYHSNYSFPYSYIFSHYGSSAGWATWKRCWDQMDFKLSKMPEFLSLGGLKNVLTNKKAVKYFEKKMKKLYNNPIKMKHIWDIQANFTILSNGGLSITPEKNLISNIGFIGTHSNSKGRYHFIATDNDYKITSHPKFVCPLIEFENFFFKQHYMNVTSLPNRIKKKFISLLDSLNE